MADFDYTRLPKARSLAGYRNIEQLAEAIGEKGLGVRKLRQVEQGRSTLEPRDIEAIAKACRLPVEFFTASDEQLSNALWQLRGAVARDAPLGGGESGEGRRGPGAPRRRVAWPATTAR